MGMQENITYASMTDEQITAIRKRIETFTKSSETFDKYCNHVSTAKGEKTWRQRRLIKPRVKASEVKKAVENIAPKSQRIAVETFEHSIDIYRDKVTYTAEDVLYGYDDIVSMAGDTLAEIGTQKLDFIKGKPFVNSKCTVTYDTSVLKTLAKTAIILKKNGAKTWMNGKWLALMTPETLEKVRVEVEAKGVAMSEPMKEEVESGVVSKYGKWLFAEVSHDLLYKNSTTQYIVCLGKRSNGNSPVDVCNLQGIEVIDNPLGSGVIVDEDGNYTADDNKQLGSVAMNINGIGSYINDDLCIIDIEVAVDEIGESALPEASKTGFVSASPAKVAVTATGLTALYGIDSNGKAVNNTLIAVKSASAVSAASKWSATYTYTDDAGSSQTGYAKVVAVTKTTNNNDTCIVEVPNGITALTIAIAS